MTPSGEGVTMIGCPHNITRLIHWPDHLSGGLVTLTCPHGCPDIYWAMSGTPRTREGSP